MDAPVSVPGLIYYRCTPDWKGKTVAIIGNGPSLRGVDLSPLAGLKIICTNGSYKLYPTADVLMCSDRHWLAEFSHDWSAFKGSQIVVTQPQAVVTPDPRIVYMKTVKVWRTMQPFEHVDTLAEGHTSVSTSISLSVLRGAAKILLLGVDLSPGPAGERRWDSPEKDSSTAMARYAMMNRHFGLQAVHVRRRRVSVLNCNPKTRMTAYPKTTLEQALRSL